MHLIFTFTSKGRRASQTCFRLALLRVKADGSNEWCAYSSRCPTLWTLWTHRSQAFGSHSSVLLFIPNLPFSFFSFRSHSHRRSTHRAHPSQPDSHTMDVAGAMRGAGKMVREGRSRLSERGRLIYLMSLLLDHFTSLLSQRDSAGTPERKAPFLLCLPMYTCSVGGHSSWNLEGKTRIYRACIIHRLFSSRSSLSTRPYPSTRPRLALPLDNAVRCGPVPLISAHSTSESISPPFLSHTFLFPPCCWNKLRFPPY